MNDQIEIISFIANIVSLVYGPLNQSGFGGEYTLVFFRLLPADVFDDQEALDPAEEDQSRPETGETLGSSDVHVLPTCRDEAPA